MNYLTKRKSYVVQLVLSILLGPFGLFYSNVAVAVVLSLICILLAGMFGLGIYLTWLLAPFTGVYCVWKNNQLVEADMELLKNGQE